MCWPGCVASENLDKDISDLAAACVGGVEAVLAADEAACRDDCVLLRWIVTPDRSASSESPEISSPGLDVSSAAARRYESTMPRPFSAMMMPTAPSVHESIESALRRIQPPIRSSTGRIRRPSTSVSPISTSAGTIISSV